ncbi:unnamed protein product [Symbiodinium microadriaticum]|nr:unnamed protein product [Symbiodinium microadriaticum]
MKSALDATFAKSTRSLCGDLRSRGADGSPEKRGLQFEGATTTGEYKRLIQNQDKAFERRFVIVELFEPSEVQTRRNSEPQEGEKAEDPRPNLSTSGGDRLDTAPAATDPCCFEGPGRTSLQIDSATSGQDDVAVHLMQTMGESLSCLLSAMWHRRKPGGGEPGRGKGKAKGHKGAAPSQGQPEQPQAPRVAALPAAPEAAGLSLPKAAPSGATAGGAASSSNTDQNLLKALLTHVAQMDNVPEELATLVGQHKDEAYRAQGKAMHKVVARQQEAQRALSKVREDRQAYELAWGQYLEQLSTLMETQLQERATTLEKFDASEDAWRKQLEEASAELSKKAAQHLSPSMDVEVQEISDQEIEEREKQVDDAIEEAKLQHSRQAREHTDAKAKDLVKAMKNLREQLPEKQRDGSRTPRRSGSKEPSGPYMSRMGLYGPCYYPDISLEGRCRHRNALVRQLCLTHERFSNSLSQRVRLIPGACAATVQRKPQAAPEHGSASKASPVATQLSLEALSQHVRSLACTATVPLMLPCAQVYTGPSPTGTQWRQMCAEDRALSACLSCPADLRNSVEALSQQSRLLACTDTDPHTRHDSQVCTGPGNVCTGLQHACSDAATPPFLTLGPSSFSDIRLRITAAVDIYPVELDRPEVRQRQLSSLSWLNGWRVGGSVCNEAQQDRYALMATDRHLQLRTMRRGWSINELVSDIVGVIPRVLSVRFLVHRLAHLPAVQVVVTTREAPTTASAVPLDFRDVQGRICTLNVETGTSNDYLARRVFEECPTTHCPQQDFQMFLPDGGVLQAFPAPDDWPDFVRGAPGAPALWPIQQELEVADDDEHVNLLQTAAGRTPTHKTAFCQDAGHERPIVSFLPNSPCCPVSEDDPPSLLKRRLSSEPAKATGDQWQLHPQALSEPRYTGIAVAYTTWGKPDDSTRHLFTVFDSRRHVSAITSNDAAKIADFAQRAIDTAPGSVRALQFLTVPMPGLPLPQVVLTFVNDPAGALALPWDCREIGLPIRTVPHQPGEQLRQAAASLQNTVRHEPDLALRISDGRLLVLDVAGLINEALPAVLIESQWLRVEPPIWSDAGADGHLRLPSMFESLRLGSPAGIPVTHSTTSTTTGMQAASATTFRIRLFGDGKEVSHDVQPPCPQLDLVLCLLLGKLQQLTSHSRGPTNIMMAKAQPSPTDGVQEVLFLSYPADDFASVPVFIDGRPQGGSLILAALPRLTTTEHAVPDFFRGGGCFALVNGAPAHLAQRTVMPGDFVQLGCSGIFVPHTAATAIMDQLPQTDVYGYMFAAQLHAGDATFLQRVRERRRAAKVWQPLENVITIVGPAHGPVRLRMDCLFVPTVAEVREALIPMTEFNSMRLAMAYTTAQIPGAALFVSVCPQSDLRTVLLPLAHSPAHFIVLMVPSLAEDLGYLPLDPQQRILWAYDRWRHGQILAIFTLPASMARPVHRHIRPPRPRPGVTYSPGGRVVPRSGTSLAQIRRPHSNSQDRCRRAARQWQVDEQQPCIGGLPREVHLRLQAIPVGVGAEAAQLAHDGPDSHTDHNLSGHADATSHPPQRASAHACRSIPTPLGRRAFPTSAFSDGSGCNTLTFQGPDRLTVCPADVPQLPSAVEVPDKVVIQLDAHIPRPRAAVAWGVNPEICAHCVAGHELCHLCGPEVPSVINPTAAVAWNLLPPWPDGDLACDELFVFTDGSFFPKAAQATWAMVAIIRSGSHVFRAGYWANLVHPMSKAVRCPSAYDGELEALLHALGLLTATRCSVCHIGADCESAISAVTGACPTTPDDRLARAAVGLHALAVAQGQTVHFHKVPAHSGCGFNDLADQLAKLVGRGSAGPPMTGPWEDFWQGIDEMIVDRLWLTAMHPNAAISLPPLLEDGTWAEPNCCLRSEVRMDHFYHMAPAPACPVPFALSLRILQYNPLSLRPTGAVQLLARGLRRHRIQIAGFQETRLKQTGMTQQEGFWVFHSACTAAGVGGTQIWIQQHEQWQRSAFSILHAEPQVLLVLGNVRGQPIVILSAHAPPSTKPVEELEAWWCHLRTVLHKAPAASVPICCVDANATFLHDVDATVAQPKCANARLMRDLLDAKGLSHSPAFLRDDTPIYSWVSPQGYRKLIDYVLLPSDWSTHVEAKPAPDLGDLFADIDHQPVLVSLDVVITAETPHTNMRPRHNWHDVHTMSAVRDAAGHCPHIPWEISGTVHVDRIQQHLSAGLQHIAPHDTLKARNPAIRPETLEKIRCQRHLGRCYRRTQRTSDRAFLQLCLSAWRHGAHTQARLLHVDKQLRVNATYAWIVFYRQCRVVRRSLLHDKATFARRTIEESRSAGPAAWAHKLRAVLRVGKKFKAPALVPALTGEPQALVGRKDVLDGFAGHFAKAERANPVSIRALFEEQPPTCREQTLEGDTFPTLADLASGFASLQKGRASGLSGLPCELYRAAPLELAFRYWPVICKTILRDCTPAQWSGGLAVAIPKPNKPSDQFAGYRSIMLLEADGKGVQKAIRPDVVQVLRDVKVADQFGGLPGSTLQLPSALVRAHLHYLKRAKKCGALVFIDAASAYYAITRDGIALTAAQRADDDFLLRRAKLLFTDPTLQAHFVACVKRGEVAEALAAKPATRILLQKHLAKTWYVGRQDASSAFVAESGTAPGAPLADAMFSLVFAGLLRETRDFLLRRGIQAQISGLDVDNPGFSPTWADDVCLLLQVLQADDLETAVADATAFFLDALARNGLQANLGCGKTEALLACFGPGSANTRRSLLTASVPRIRFQGEFVQGHICLAEQYTHLGSVIRADGQVLPDITRRRELARELYRPIKRKLLGNPYLFFQEKTELLRGRVLPKFLYGSGLWSLKTVRERQAVEETIFSFYRGSFRPIFGFPSQGYTNEEIAGALRLPLPSELLKVEQTRVLVRLHAAGMHGALGELCHDLTWWGDATAAAREIGILPREASTDSCPISDLCTDLATLRSACKRFLKAGIQKRKIPAGLLRQRMPCDVVEVLNATSGGLSWICADCGAAFLTKRRLAVHCSKRHGLRAPHTTAAMGTACERCGTEHWTQFRLSEHLRRSPACLHTYVEADWQVEPPKTAHDSHAWRPAAKLSGPQPWWATLGPV